MGNPPASDAWTVRHENRLSDRQSAVKPKDKKVVQRIRQSMGEDQVENGKDSDGDGNSWSKKEYEIKEDIWTTT